MKTFAKKPFFLFLLFALTACGSKSSDTAATTTADGYTLSENGIFLAKVEWPEELKAGQGVDNKAIVTFLTPESTVPAEVSFTEFHPRMPTHGHGTNEGSQTIEARADEPNVFDISGIMFRMAGEATTWVTDVVATVDGQADEVEIPISRDVE